MKDPKRFLDAEGGAPESLRRLLEASDRDVATEDEVGSLETRLSPLLWAPPPAPPPATLGKGAALTKAGASVVTKVGAVLILAGGASVVAVSLKHGAPQNGAAAVASANAARSPVTGGDRANVKTPATPGSAGSQNAAPVPAPNAPVPGETELGEGVSPAENTEATPDERASGTPHAVTGMRDVGKHPSSAALSAPRPEKAPAIVDHEEAAQMSEAELLGRAQAALAGSPALSLRLAETHAQRFPRGALVQEREVLAIDALSRLGRKTEARARAERFLARYSGSAHRRKVESLVGIR